MAHKTLVLITILLWGVTLASAEVIYVSGNVSGTWTTDSVLVTGEIRVPSGSTLSITPGVRVIFQGHYPFLVYGYLQAVGNPADSILFTAANESDGWRGLRFINAPDSSHLSYCIIERGRSTGVYPDSNGYGGGLYAYHSNPSIRHSTFRQNYCEWYGGGACFWGQSNALVEECVFTDNTSDDDAGAIFCGNSSNPRISRCSLINNWTLAWGGGICSFLSSPTVEYCTISDNWGNNGGAYFCSYSAGGILDHCIISGNSANLGGGIYNMPGSNLQISNCTIFDNAAPGNGGGIYLNSSSSTIVNTIVANNLGSGGVYFSSSPNTTVTYSDFYLNQPANFAGTSLPPNLGQIVTVNGNGDPCDRYYNLLLNPLFYNPLQADFRLQPGSPGIDAGDPFSQRDPDSTIADMGAIFTPWSQGTFILGGNVSGTWTAARSPYVVGGDIIVLQGQTLNISAGVTVVFQGRYKMTIQGLLLANGAANDSIVFTAADTSTGWHGLHFINSSSSGSNMSYCLIEHGKALGISPDSEACGGGVYCDHSSPIISHCSFIGNEAALNGGGIACFVASPIIQSCDFIGNWAGHYGGGLYVAYGNPSIQLCNIEENYSAEGGGGIQVSGDCYPAISNCTVNANTSYRGGGIYFEWCRGTLSYSTISGNFAQYGAGLACNYTSSLLNIHHCTINDNTAQVNGGGIWSSHYHSVYQHGTVNQCTIVGNSSLTGSGIYCAPYSGLNIVNSIIANNSGNGGFYRSSNTTDSITYGDFHNNIGGNFAGSGIPSTMGILTTVNANGDSCDVFHNILQNPSFVNAPLRDFHLLQDSHCIDAGNPSVIYFDPDGTVADMGAFYYDQSIQSPLSLTLTPLNPPIFIPSGGGSFQFTTLIENSSPEPVQFDFWTKVTFPGGGGYGPIINLSDLTLSPSSNRSRTFTQSVGSPVGPGTFIYRGYVGQYPTIIWAQDQFEVIKLASAEDEIADYTGSGWEQYFEEAGEGYPASSLEVTSVASEFVLQPPYPNPFNPTTVIRFDLPEAAKVTLEVFDINGRAVGVQHVESLQSGTHEITFDGSGLPSGIYVYRLTAGASTASGKMVLLK
ncbi:MAG: right-handed parallel beta-helix repeat-containing protein [bacterium]|nr:right-handed parallel beta-helix repeat-containing protein [bacterium]